MFIESNKRLSAVKAWQFRRNLVIYLAWKGGCSKRMLADVFDLGRTQIATIIDAMREEDESRQIAKNAGAKVFPNKLPAPSKIATWNSEDPSVL